MSELKLSKVDVIKLISMYRKKECLWNSSSSLYKRNDLKQKAWAELAKEFKTSVYIIKKKIKFLRTSFNAEKKKVESSNSKSGSSEDAYEPTLFYYKELSFMRRTRPVRESVNSASRETTVECVSDKRPQVDRVINADAPRVKKSKPNRARESCDKSTGEAVASMKGSPAADDMYSAFGKSIAMQLMQLPILEATKAMASIQRLVSESIANNIMKNVRPCVVLPAPVSFGYNATPRESRESELSSQDSPREEKWHT